MDTIAAKATTYDPVNHSKIKNVERRQLSTLAERGGASDKRPLYAIKPLMYKAKCIVMISGHRISACTGSRHASCLV